MRNRYPGSCSVCARNVAPGDGLLFMERGRWTVTHAESCPTDPPRHVQVRSMLDRCFVILGEPGSNEAHVVSALVVISRLVAEEHLDEEKFLARVLASPALRKLDRVKVEELLDAHWSVSVSS